METPIYWAASNGHTEIVKSLAPLTDNPNAPNANVNGDLLQVQLPKIQKFVESSTPTTLPKNVNQDHQQSHPR